MRDLRVSGPGAAQSLQIDPQQEVEPGPVDLLGVVSTPSHVQLDLGLPGGQLSDEVNAGHPECDVRRGEERDQVRHVAGQVSLVGGELVELQQAEHGLGVDGVAGGLHDEAGRDDGRLGGVLQRQLRPEGGDDP